VTPTALLAELRRRGVELAVHGDKLRYTAPKGALTDELREGMRQHKQALIELLSIELLPVGWRCVVECDALGGERIVLCRDMATMEKAPATWPRYTLAEVLALAYAGVAGDDLQAVHKAKRVFGGVARVEEAPA